MERCSMHQYPKIGESLATSKTTRFYKYFSLRWHYPDQVRSKLHFLSDCTQTPIYVYDVQSDSMSDFLHTVLKTKQSLNQNIP